jgi:hypothetical protein
VRDHQSATFAREALGKVPAVESGRPKLSISRRKISLSASRLPNLFTFFANVFQ